MSCEVCDVFGVCDVCDVRDVCDMLYIDRFFWLVPESGLKKINPNQTLGVFFMTDITALVMVPPNSTFLRDPPSGSTFYNETDLSVRGPFSSESWSVASGSR